MLENDNVIQVSGAVQFHPLPPTSQESSLTGGCFGDELSFEVHMRTSPGMERNLIERCKYAWKNQRACYLGIDPQFLPFPITLEGEALEQIFVPISSIGKAQLEDELGFSHRTLRAVCNLRRLTTEVE